MSKNLEIRLSPMEIGLEVDPTFPMRNVNPVSENFGAYRLDTGARTLQSGDIVRVGGTRDIKSSLFGVVEVDHQDNLADADGKPVIDFGMNVWNMYNVLVGDKPANTDYAAFNVVSHSLIGDVCYIGNMSPAAVSTIYGTETVDVYRLGFVLDPKVADLNWDIIFILDKVQVLMGGSGVPIKSTQVTGSPRATQMPAVTGLAIALRHHNFMYIEWTELPPQNFVNIQYQIQYNRGSFFHAPTAETITVSSSPHPIYSLANNTEYQFRIRAIDGFGNVPAGPWSAAISGTTVPL